MSDQGRPLHKLASIAATLEASLDQGPVASRVGRASLRERIDAVDLHRGGLSLSQSIERLASWLGQWGLRTGHRRFFGYPNPSSSMESVAGDALAALFDAQCALWDSAPAAVEIERTVLDALAARAGWSMESRSFTTGASESLTSALTAALLRRAPMAAQDGLFALGARPRVYASRQAHRSLHKSARMLGWGERAVVEIAAPPPTYAMDIAALERAIQSDLDAGFAPLAVVATAGSTVCGAIDPLPAIAELCAKHGLFFYCDAALAGGAVTSEAWRGLLAGIERADAIAWDAHKFPGLALGTGMLWMRDAALVRAAFDVDATYVAAGSEHPYASSAQWSRRAIGLKVWLSLATDGIDGWGRAFEQRMRLGERLRREARARGWTVHNDSALFIVCLRREGEDERALKARVHALAQQHAWVDLARTSDGVAVIRAAISSSRTTEQDVDALVSAL